MRAVAAVVFTDQLEPICSRWRWFACEPGTCQQLDRQTRLPGNLPLRPLLPYAPNGCTLQPTPTHVELLIAIAGAYEHGLAVPMQAGSLGIS